MKHYSITSEEEKNKLNNAIKEALNKLYKKDFFLIENCLHEQCIGHQFGLYLRNELNQCGYADYDLDAEYNRHKMDKKIIPSYPNGARPDFILHKRNNDNDNILIIELKKGKRPRITENDKNKIKWFMESPFNYKYGATILFKIGEPDFKGVFDKTSQDNIN